MSFVLALRSRPESLRHRTTPVFAQRTSAPGSTPSAGAVDPGAHPLAGAV